MESNIAKFFQYNTIQSNYNTSMQCIHFAFQSFLQSSPLPATRGNNVLCYQFCELPIIRPNARALAKPTSWKTEGTEEKNKRKKASSILFNHNRSHTNWIDFSRASERAGVFAAFFFCKGHFINRKKEWFLFVKFL